MADERRLITSPRRSGKTHAQEAMIGLLRDAGWKVEREGGVVLLRAPETRVVPDPPPPEGGAVHHADLFAVN